MTVEDVVNECNQRLANAELVVYRVFASDGYGEELEEGHFSTEEKANKAMATFKEREGHILDGWVFEIEPIIVD